MREEHSPSDDGAALAGSTSDERIASGNDRIVFGREPGHLRRQRMLFGSQPDHFRCE